MLCLILGIGGAWADNVVYTLDATNSSNQGTNNAYASAGDVTVDGITWNATGNITFSPWRIGGKASAANTPLSKTDREIYSKTAYASPLTQVTVEIGAASSVTINSIKLIHSTNRDFSSATTLTSSSTSASSTHTFAPVGGFPANSYYKVVFNITISSTSNKYIEFKNIKFYSSETSKEVTSISVKTAPSKLVYTEGDKFNPAGLEIVKKYDDDSSEVLEYTGNESYFSFTPSLATSLQESDEYVQITVGRKSVKQYITVNPTPSHTAHFSLNGTIEPSYNCIVKEGEYITFPSSITDINNKNFQGWLTTPIDDTTNDKPSFVNTFNTKMGTNDVTFYAVFATEVTPASIGSSTLSSDAIKSNFTQTAMAYDGAERTYDDGVINWSAKGYSGINSTFIQIRQNTVLSYIKVEAPKAITNVKFAVTNGSGANFNGSIYVTTEPTSNPGTDSNVKGSTSVNAKAGEISEISGDNTTLYIQSSGAARMFDIEVTYGVEGEYSEYCTTISAPTGSFKIGSKGFGTYFTDQNYVMPEGVEGGIVVEGPSEVSIEWVYESGAVVPSETALLLKGTAGQTYEYEVTSEEGDEWQEYNNLIGTTVAKPAYEILLTEWDGAEEYANELYYFYKLSSSLNGTEYGWYWGAENGNSFTCAANKCVLWLTKSAATQSNLRALTLIGGDTPTSIEAIEAANANATIFDLQGRRVRNAQNGVYVVNGKKVIR